ncbi:hypothetical protein DL98DRAFT_150490 [Cadophora sp. DSE1049]|nr:hypothetical protein DL98DRAFT_150490 [Cadophora sp. DSE1049]
MSLSPIQVSSSGLLYPVNRTTLGVLMTLEHDPALGLCETEALRNTDCYGLSFPLSTLFNQPTRSMRASFLPSFEILFLFPSIGFNLISCRILFGTSALLFFFFLSSYFWVFLSW